MKVKKLRKLLKPYNDYEIHVWIDDNPAEIKSIGNSTIIAEVNIIVGELKAGKSNDT